MDRSVWTRGSVERFCSVGSVHSSRAFSRAPFALACAIWRASVRLRLRRQLDFACARSTLCAWPSCIASSILTAAPAHAPPPWFLASCFWLLASPVCAVPQRSNNAAASSQERPRVPSPNLLFLAPCPSLQQLQAQQAQQATLQPEPDFGPPLSVAVVCSGFVWP